jgi:hypothetical protein
MEHCALRAVDGIGGRTVRPQQLDEPRVPVVGCVVQSMATLSVCALQIRSVLQKKLSHLTVT